MKRNTIALLSAILFGSAGFLVAQQAPAPAPMPAPATRPTSTPAAEFMSLRRGSGISGPGAPFSLDGPVFTRRRRPNSPAVANGLIPNIKPLLDMHVRDTIVIVGGHGNYYLTGSNGDDIWNHNDGVELWRQAPWREMPAIVKVEFAADGKIQVARQPEWNLMPTQPR